jgi:hypothetical protein
MEVNIVSLADLGGHVHCQGEFDTIVAIYDVLLHGDL